MPIKKVPYLCPRCGYSTEAKACMRKHLYGNKKQCSAKVNEVQLTDEVKGTILNNRVYRIPKKRGRPPKEKSHQTDINDYIDQNHVKVHEDECNEGSIDQLTLLQLEISRLKNENRRLRIELINYKARRTEDFYQLIVENWLGGSHRKIGIGVTDVTTDIVHAEIKRWKEWKHALGQLTAYQDDCPKEQLHVYLFGPYSKTRKQKAVKTFNNKNIQCFDFKEEERDGARIICIINASTGEEIYIHSLDSSWV